MEGNYFEKLHMCTDLQISHRLEISWPKFELCYTTGLQQLNILIFTDKHPNSIRFHPALFKNILMWI